MRPFFGAEGCAVNEAGISTAGNPLSRMFDAAAADPLHARQMQAGQLAGARPPMPFGPAAGLMDPMMARQAGGLEQAWQEVGPAARPPGMLGAAMPNQLAAHLQGPVLRPQGPGFFMEGPRGAMPGGLGADWAGEFAGVAPPGHRGVQLAQAPLRPPGAEWAAEFAGPRMMPPPEMQMEEAFRQAEMERAFMQASAPAAEMEAAFAQGAMEAAFAQAQQGEMEAAFREAQESEMEKAFAEAASEQADLGQAAQMVEMLRNSGNPKFARSQFVSFIDKVSKGDLQFKENTVIDREGNQVDWDSLYDTEAAAASDAPLESMWQASATPETLEKVWGEAGMPAALAGMPAGLESAWQAGMPAGLEGAWQEAGMPAGGLEAAWAAGANADLEQLWSSARQSAMDDAWGLAGDESAMLEQAWAGEHLNMEQAWTSARNSGEYQFSKENPYLESADPLAEAMQLLREGRDREALLALEAEVQRNPESSEGWRQLGQLYAELDQDVEAIQCLRRGHEVDPYNLDSLLALGVSCTNELDQLPALRYLRMWIENHEEHQVLAQGMEPPAEYEYEAWRQQVTMLFNQAAAANPLDANVFIALGVMENINRNYEGAVRALATACRLRPNDHTAWNKLGATLANSGKSEQAVVAYHQGLQLKPNYARSWSNLAIAHANLGQHEDAARFYLSSLVLNPEATHIWNFLHSAVLNMNNVNAFEAIDQRDLQACTRLIQGVLDPSTLPKPSQELPHPPDEILGTIGL